MAKSFQKHIKTLPQSKGGYCYISIQNSMVVTFPKKNKTRLLCTLDSHLSFPCAFISNGNGQFYIILSKKKLKKLNKKAGDKIDVQLKTHPHPLGVEIPEVLEIFLQEDKEAKSLFEKLTDGKKRSLIFTVSKIKNIDLQIERIIQFLNENIR